jgi:broad specificity phosphatase PhoE
MVFKEDSRLREQDFGNFQRNQAQTRRQRNLFGRFWYRMPEGESTSDTYDRVCGLYQSIMIHDSLEESGELGKAVDNYVMVAHGLSLRLLLMRILGWNVRRFNEVYNLDNGEIVILLKGSRGQYHLHSKLHEAKVKITEEETFKQFIQDYWTHCAEIGVAPPDGLTRNDVEELNAARDEMRTRGKL